MDGGVFSNPRTNKLLLTGGAMAGGAASLVLAEKAGLSPAYAGMATGGLALLGTQLFPSAQIKDAFFAAGLGATGVAGVQLLASFMGKRAANAAASATPTPAAAAQAQAKRQADGDSQPYITRGELNDALANLADKNADQHRQTCDLMTVLRDEIRKVMREPQPAAAAPSPTTTVGAVGQSASPNPYLYPLQAFQQPQPPQQPTARDYAGEDEYMRNTYGEEWERNAADNERDANPDEYEANAYGGRNSDDERNGSDDERNGDGDEPRNCDVGERNAYFDDPA